MIQAILSAAAEILRVTVVLLERFALWLEANRLGVAWPVALALVLQVLAAALNVSIWWSRGTVWPVRCGYPETTSRDHADCQNRVFGEWHKCHQHRRARQRSSDRHQIDPTMRRWQTIKRGKTVERKDIYGRGVIRTRSDLMGLLYYRGFARPPETSPGWCPSSSRTTDVACGSYGNRSGTDPRAWTRSSPSSCPPASLPCCPLSSTRPQFVLLLLPFGMTMVGGAILLLTRAPAATSERAAAEYGAAFFFSLAVTAFKNGIVGQRKPDRSVTPSMDWLGRSLQEGAGAFGLVLLLAAASTYFVMVILPAVPATIAGLLLLSAAGKPPRRRRRRRW